MFERDIAANGEYRFEAIQSSRFLIIGGVDTIGSAIYRELFARNPRVLHVVDISEQKQRIGGCDYVFNASVLKHVCSEKDLYTLMRMIDTDIFNTGIMMLIAKECGTKKYFCASTNKAANPVDMLRNLGHEPVQCATEDEVRCRVIGLKSQYQYPVYFFRSDTTGEKDFEEF